ncbi:MAG: restriction endonuclease subunit S [Candidatus Latescibacteria bacterium]|nr:restriction endonuclease subunit S [Candidatus Latescibacterota bacterium]
MTRILASVPVVLPPREHQERIIGVISAYDDLIENNRRRIKLLEQAVRLLYKEWFVHLRFPGHQHVKIKDGVPEGWERKPLGEVASLNYGKSLKADNRLPGSIPVYGSSGIVGTHNRAMVNGPMIIVGRKGNVGSVYWSPEDCFPIDTVYYVQSESCSLRLYYALRTVPFISTDVAVPGLNRDFAHSRQILTPSSSYHRLFENTVGPFHQQIDILRRQNAKLERARDLLLPKLMNGDITI